MKRKKELFMAAVIVMTLGMAACNGTNNQTAPEPEIVVESMTVNSSEIEISYIPYTKYQVNLLSDCDYYTDALEEPDSPEFVFIAPAGKSVYRDVTDIQVDDSQNVTITVCETSAKIAGSNRGPLTKVKIYPYPASVTVVDEKGNTLSGN